MDSVIVFRWAESFTDLSEVQSLNTDHLPTDSTESGITNSSNSLNPSKVYDPMYVRVSGRCNSRTGHDEKALPPIFRSPLFGKFSLAILKHLSNARSLISVKDSGNVTTSRCPHSENILSPIVVTPSAIINLRTGISSSPE